MNHNNHMERHMKRFDHCLWLCRMAQSTGFFPREKSAEFKGKILLAHQSPSSSSGLTSTLPIASRGSNSLQCYSKVVKNACALPQLHPHICSQWQAETDGHILARQEVRQFLFPAAQVPVLSIPMMNGTEIPLASAQDGQRHGLPILGAPIGTSAYSTA